MSRFTAHDSEAIDFIFVGIKVRDGRAEEFVTLEPADDAYKTESGADGQLVRYATHNTLYKMVIRLLKTSSVNQQLAALHAIDTIATNGAAVGPMLLKDNNGATNCASAAAWVVKAPQWKGATAPGTVEWQAACFAKPSSMIFGGN